MEEFDFGNCDDVSQAQDYFHGFYDFQGTEYEGERRAAEHRDLIASILAVATALCRIGRLMAERKPGGDA
jgi:hypothetical protein